jgi:inactive STAND
MFAVQHLQRKRAELREVYDSLSGIIRRLWESHAVETDPAVMHKLEYQIQEYEERRDRIVVRIEDLDTKINTLDHSTNLYHALLKLDYRNQVALFRKLLSQSQVGAFMIYGEPEYGQRWLLNRLIQSVSYCTAGKIVSINLMSIAHRWGLEALHREFRRQQGLARTLSLTDVVDQVHSWWQTQTVILIFHNLNAMDVEHMQELVQGFWKPLVEKAMSEPCSSANYKLLVFLIDNDGCIDAWPFEVAEQLDDTWQPYIPVKPPKLTPILQDELMTWMTYEGERLPLKLQVEDILQRKWLLRGVVKESMTR